ncbi:MAG: hypothetical protein K0S38_967 [Candidatus Paceibacter sp.]|nr:hypothetical protein [Candidatus Paceibacter sp.]
MEVKKTKIDFNSTLVEFFIAIKTPTNVFSNMAQSKKILALDIDDTLADTTRYFAHRLNERFGNPEGLAPDEIFKKYKIIPDVPYWQTAEILAWREEQSFSNEAQEAVPPTEGAIVAAKKLNEHFEILYISSRPKAVEKGTCRWLEKHGFPAGELILRTTYDDKNGNAWKAAIIEQKWPFCIGIVEDNPEIIGYFSRLYKGTVYLYGSDTISEETEISVVPCPDWNTVRKHIEQTFTNEF